MRRSALIIIAIIVLHLLALYFWWSTQQHPTANISQTEWEPVVTMNTTRSSYRSDESVTIGMAVVNAGGFTVCDADLSLVITAPNGDRILRSTAEATIEHSEECQEENVTDLPDYVTSFTPTMEGIYTLKLTAGFSGWSLSTEQSVQVEPQKFLVAREGSQRIHPAASYTMRMGIRAEEAFTGTIREKIPSTFVLEKISGNGKRIEEDGQTYIVWENQKIDAGTSLSLLYTYDAPNMSPALFQVGPVTLASKEHAVWNEERTWDIASDAVANNGRLLYGDVTNLGQIKLQVLTSPFTFGSEITTSPTSSSSHIAFIAAKAAPTRDEIVVGQLKEDGRLDVVLGTSGYDVNTDYSAAWNNPGTTPSMTCSGTEADCTRAFDIEYESLGGRAMVVYADNVNQKLYYCYYNGTSWAPVSNCAPTNGSNDISLTSNGRPTFVSLKAKPNSNEMLLGVSIDVSGTHEVETFIWNGSSWGSNNVATDTTNASTLGLEKGSVFDVAYETLSGYGMVAWGTTSAGSTMYKLYTGSWGSEQTGPALVGGNGTVQGTNLIRDPKSNRIAWASNDDGNDGNFGIWKADGSTAGWTMGNEDSTLENQEVGPEYTDVVWESFNAGGDSMAMWVAQNAAGSPDPEYETATCNGAGCTFSSIATNMATCAGDDALFNRMFRSPNSDELMLLVADIDRNLMAQQWDGSSWQGTAACALEADISGASADNTIYNSRPATFEYVPYSAWSRNWRFYDDETSDNPSTGLNGAAENTAPTGVDPEEYIRLRMNVAELSGMGQTDARKKLQYTSGCTPNTDEFACTWVDVGDTGETSAVWRYATTGETCSGCADGSTSTTSRLTGTNQGSPSVFYVADKDAAADTDFDHTALLIREIDYPLKAESVQTGQTYYFRMYDVDQYAPVLREQDNDGNNDCASSTCTYPSLTISGILPSIFGTVYTDTGTTVMGAGKTVSLSINGGAVSASNDTDAGGQFYVTPLTITKGDVYTIFLDDETEDAVTVTVGSGSSMTGVNLYQNRLIVRNETGGTITNAHLATADGSGDSDIGAIYNMVDGDTAVQTAWGKELFVWDAGAPYNETEYVTGGRVKVHDLYVGGSMAMGTYGLTISGSIVTADGTFTTSTGTYLTSKDGDSGAPEQIDMGSNAFDDVIISDNSLIGYWKLDDGTGATLARDSSQYGINGTLNRGVSGLIWSGAPFTPQVLAFHNPTALHFDGTDDYIIAGDYQTIDLATRLTICAWVHLDSLIAPASIVAKTTTNPDGPLLFYDDLGTLRNQQYTLFVGDPVDSDTVRVESATNSALLNTWQHVCGTIQLGNATGLRLYLDGVEDANSPASLSTIASLDSGTNPLYIGIRNLTNAPINGLLDDIRIYNRILSSSEIAALAAGNPGSGSGYYKLQSNLDVNGDLRIYDSTLDVNSAGNYSVNVAGNWENNGNFIARNGTVTLDASAGVDQTMSGSTVFYNFTKTVTSASTLYVDFRARQSASGALTLRGQSSNLLSVRSTKTGSASNLLLDGDSGTQTIDYLDVQDSTASGGITLVCFQVGEGCVNSGHNYNWNFWDPVTTVTGTVYTDTGTTVIGANKTVAISVNGAAAATTAETDAGGQFVLSAAGIDTGVLTLYLDEETEKAVTVTIGSGSSMTGVNLYQNRLIIRHETAGTVTNANLATADDNGDSDIGAIYSMTDGDTTVQTAWGKELFVWNDPIYGATTFSPGGRVQIHDLYVGGTMAMGTYGLTISGSIVTADGTFTTSTGTYLTSKYGDSGAPEQIDMGSNAFDDLIIDNGLVGYWRLDDGTGSTVARDSSRYGNNGTLSRGATGLIWNANAHLSNTSKFYNPNGLDFDGSDDVISNTTTNGALNNLAKLSIVGWIYAEGSGEGPGFPNIIQKEFTSTTPYWRWKYSDQGSYLKTTCFLVSWTSNGHWCAPSNTIPFNTWKHVVITMRDINNASTDPSFYIDGVSISPTEVSTPSGSPPTDTTKLYIGDIADNSRAFDGKIDDLRVYNRVLSSSEAAALAVGNPGSGSGYYKLQSNLDVNGDLRIYDSTLDVNSAGNYSVNVAGNWENNGDFKAQLGTVTLDASAGVDQTMSGSTVFYNFTKTVTSASTLYVDFRSRQSASGALTIRGQSSNLLSVRSTKTGSASNLLLDGDSGTQTIDYLDVKDSDANGGSTLLCYSSSEQCNDSGNNTNWTFINPPKVSQSSYRFFETDTAGSSASAAIIDDASDLGLNVPGWSVVHSSGGNIYAILEGSASACEVWKSTNAGSTWVEKDSVNAPSCSGMLGAAIDKKGTIHILTIQGTTIEYSSFSTLTDTFIVTAETVYSGNLTPEGGSITTDSNNIPHIVSNLYVDPVSSVSYANRIGGVWNARVEVEAVYSNKMDITINEDNIPEISYVNGDSSNLTAAVGNQNNTTSFTLQNIDTTINATEGIASTSIGVDDAGNTWVAFVDDNGGSGDLRIVQHRDADSWSTWQSSLSTATSGNEPTLAIVGSGIYVLYENSSDDIAYNKYAGAWQGATTLQTGTFSDVRVKWSYLANHDGTDLLDYLYTDGTDVYYAALGLDAHGADVGTALANQNTAATAPAQGTNFHLRMALKASGSTLPLSSQNYQLEFAQKSGSCDTAFSGESYAEVSPSSGVIRYADGSAIDGTPLIRTAADPLFGSGTLAQTYEEQNNFTNSVSSGSNLFDMEWDFLLTDNSAPTDTSYCFRIAKSDNSVLDYYTIIPEITTAGGNGANNSRGWFWFFPGFGF